MDKKPAKNPKSGTLRVETHRSGHFTFEIGLDFSELDPLRKRVEDAYTRFSSIPFFPDIANKLEHIVMVSSTYGTNTIEGATLSKQETEAALNLTPEQARDEQKRRVVNIKTALTRTQEIAQSPMNVLHRAINDRLSKSEFNLPLNQAAIKELHKILTTGLNHDEPRNIPGEYRNNPKGIITSIGLPQTGGRYVPPKCLDDIKKLMGTLCEWANNTPLTELSPLYRAPLIHYYFERIHPFWDGNGRTGRLIENLLLEAADYKYSAHIWFYYLQENTQYSALFNHCRKLADKKHPTPNTSFVKFFLQTLLDTINRLQDKSNEIMAHLLLTNHIDSLATQKLINYRQHTILMQLIHNPKLNQKDTLELEPWHQVLYKKLSNKTKERDLNNLIEQKLLLINKKQIQINYFLNPDTKLYKNPKTSF